MATIEKITKSNTQVTTPEELRDFLNDGAINDLAYRLDIVDKGKLEKDFSIREHDREFKVYWIHRARKRLLVVQNSLSRLPGLFLSLPVDLDEYQTAPGAISASFIPLSEGRRVPEPYSEGMVVVGNPQAVVKVMAVAGRELSIASGIVSPEDI